MAERFDQLAGELRVDADDLMEVCRSDGSLRLEVDSLRARLVPEQETRIRAAFDAALARQRSYFAAGCAPPASFEYERPLTIRERAALKRHALFKGMFAGSVGCLTAGAIALPGPAAIAGAGIAALSGGDPQVAAWVGAGVAGAFVATFVIIALVSDLGALRQRRAAIRDALLTSAAKVLRLEADRVWRVELQQQVGHKRETDERQGYILRVGPGLYLFLQEPGTPDCPISGAFPPRSLDLLFIRGRDGAVHAEVVEAANQIEPEAIDSDIVDEFAVDLRSAQELKQRIDSPLWRA